MQKSCGVFFFLLFSSSLFFFSRLTRVRKQKHSSSLSPFFPLVRPHQRVAHHVGRRYGRCVWRESVGGRRCARALKKASSSMIPFGAVDRWLRSSSSFLAPPSLFSLSQTTTTADYGFEYSDEEVDAEDADLENDYYNSKGKEAETEEDVGERVIGIPTKKKTRLLNTSRFSPFPRPKTETQATSSRTSSRKPSRASSAS